MMGSRQVPGNPTWSMTSGPGTVTFGNINAASTTATFSTAGTYVLRLTASDTVLTAYAQCTITVNPAAGPEAPYGGKAWIVPGTIEAENYDLGGQNIGYLRHHGRQRRRSVPQR